jgi:hypothetical protein
MFYAAGIELAASTDPNTRKLAMTKGTWLVSSALFGFLATSSAQPAFVTIDADIYAPGTDVSNVFPGVTLAHLTFLSGSGLQSTPVYAGECSDMSNPNSICSAIGPASFGWQTSTGTSRLHWNSTASYIINCLRRNNPYCYNEPQHLLEVSFDAATNYVQFDSTHSSDWPWVWALDAAGNVLSVTDQRTYHQLPGPGSGVAFGYQTVTISSATANISRVIIAGNGGSSTVDSITFAVP